MEPEEAYSTSNILPLNMQPMYTANRDVFDEFVDPYEQPQLRLKPQRPSNEVVCMSKDNVGRTCPSLLPPDTLLPPPPTAGCGLQGPGYFGPFMGDGYASNFGLEAGGFPPPPPPMLPSPPLLLGAGGLPAGVTVPTDGSLWYFPRVPVQGALRPRPAPQVGLGPVGSADARTCTNAKGQARLRLGIQPGAGGAVSSLRFGNHEFIHRGGPNARRVTPLHLSIAANVPPGGTDQQRRADETGALWNRGQFTSSRVMMVAAGKTARKRVAAYTRAQAAWWRRPGTVVAGRPVLNTTDVSPYEVHKRIIVGPSSFRYVAGVTVPPIDNTVSARIATRVGLRPEFNRALAFHHPTQRWVALPRSRTLPVGAYRALVVTNSTGTRAIGVSLLDFPKPPAGFAFAPKAFYAVNVTGSKMHGTLVSVVHQLGVRGGGQQLPAGRTYAYHQHWEVGTLHKVTCALANLAVNLTGESQLREIPNGLRPSRFRSMCAAPLRRAWMRKGKKGAPGQICGPTVQGLQCPAGKKGAWCRKMLGKGWTMINGVWKLPAGCQITRRKPGCAKCTKKNFHEKKCRKCVKCKGKKFQTRCFLVNQNKPACRKCTVANRGAARCKGCVKCVKLGGGKGLKKRINVRRCRVLDHLSPKCKQCSLVKKRTSAVCKKCLACKPRAMDPRGQKCTVPLAPRCAKCTWETRNKGVCKQCVKCGRKKARRGRSRSRLGRVKKARRSRSRSRLLGRIKKARRSRSRSRSRSRTPKRGGAKVQCARVTRSTRCAQCSPAQRGTARCQRCFACGTPARLRDLRKRMKAAQVRRLKKVGPQNPRQAQMLRKLAGAKALTPAQRKLLLARRRALLRRKAAGKVKKPRVKKPRVKKPKVKKPRVKKPRAKKGVARR